MKNHFPTMRLGLYGAAAAALIGATSLAQAAQDDSSTGEAASPRLDSVVVLGSRRSDATVLSSAAPVEVVTAEQLTATGASNLSEALQHLVPSFHFPTSNPSSNAASFVRGVSLRGLATDETLVLVNGKRRHATAQLNASTTSVGKGAQSVDLNSIPLSAIERVEVLLDGAAAQYGSDAIAGVINIILKENDHGGKVSSTYGQNAKGDGLSRSLDGNYGLALPGDGFLSLSFDAWNVGDTDVSATDTRQMYFSGDRREASAPQRNWFYGSGASKRYNFVANAEAGLSDAVRAYGFATYGYRHDEGFGNLRRPQDDQTVRALYPDGFQPTLDVTSEDFSSTGGLKIDDGSGGRFDLSATYGRNRVSSVVSDTLNTSLGLASPNRFDTGDLLNEQTSLNLDYVRPIDVGLLKNPLNLATGLTYRHEAYQVFEGDVGSWINGGVPILDGPNAGKASTPGSQGFGGFSPDDAGRLERNVYGGYIDLENKVTDRLNIGIAGRSEHYSDFGWTTTGKLSARYELTPDFALRSTFSSGYRAPSLGQEAYSRTIPNVVNGVITTTRVARADSDLAKALGATDLKPEKSTNLSAGFVYKIGDKGSLTADAYQINIRDRIVLTETLSGSAVQSALTSAGFPTFSGLSYFTNGANTQTRGVDVVARYRLDNHGFGDTDLTAAFNASRTKITDVADTPSQLAASGLQLIGHQARSIIERSSPDTTLRLGATHNWQKWTTDINLVRYGTYELDNAHVALDQTFSAQWVTNLRVSYRLLADLKVSVGANNLFDSHPDEVKAGARNPLVNKYSGLSPEGGAGAFYYTSLSYDF